MSVPDKAMKLKDGKIIADQLSSMIAVQFVQATANAAGSYVVYNGEVFYLPDGHPANMTWANTVKEGPTNIGGEIADVRNDINGIETALDDKADMSDIPDVSDFYTKPPTGIPASDLASGVIPDITSMITNPSVKSAGDFLVFNGTDWVAQSLSAWQGGNY